MVKKKVRIVMDIDEEIKEALKKKAEDCGLTLTMYLAYCGMNHKPKRMPPEAVVKAKNILCDFKSKCLFLKALMKNYIDVESYVRQCEELAVELDRLLLDYQS